jgi:hypothetical protein
MATTPTKKEQVPNYDINSAKTNASTGTLINNQADLNKYGIDYSPERQEEIANFFRAEADAAYNTARNDYARTMAAEQNTLRDTIRRSQAQSVATGASRGLQAANELSAMLGLQEQAAQGAAQMQGSYAETLANASQRAMEQQNARAQVGANIAAADIAGEAQKYSMNMDYMANMDTNMFNDPYRVFSMIDYYNSIGDTATANMLKTVFMTGQGATENQVTEHFEQQKAQEEAKQAAAKRVEAATKIAEAESKGIVLKPDTTKKKGDKISINSGGYKYNVQVGETLTDNDPVFDYIANNNIPLNTPFIAPGIAKIYMRTTDGVIVLRGTDVGNLIQPMAQNNKK